MSVSQILPGFFLGGQEDRDDIEWQQHEGIQLVINVAYSGDQKRGPVFHRRVLGRSETVESLSQSQFFEYLGGNQDVADTSARYTYYLEIPADDTTWFDLSHFFPLTCAALIQAYEKRQWRVFVHCLAGVSRSVSVVIAYLLVTGRYGAHPTQCLDFVKGKRSCAKPNEGFFSQLLTWALVYDKALAQYQHGVGGENVDMVVVAGTKLQSMPPLDKLQYFMEMLRGMLYRTSLTKERASLGKLVRSANIEPSDFIENCIHLINELVSSQQYVDVPNLWNNWSEVMAGSEGILQSIHHVHVLHALFTSEYEDCPMEVVVSYAEASSSVYDTLPAVLAVCAPQDVIGADPFQKFPVVPGVTDLRVRQAVLLFVQEVLQTNLEEGRYY
eukprot:PhF_6_TR36132/c0_g1_i3/m.52460